MRWSSGRIRKGRCGGQDEVEEEEEVRAEVAEEEEEEDPAVER